MARPSLLICTKCDGGDALYERTRNLRKQRELKEVFKVEEVRCLSLCDAPCAVQLEGKKRSTVSRTALDARDAERLVDVASAFAALRPGEDLPERALPGEHAD